MCTFYQKIVVFIVYLYNPTVHNLHVYGYCLNIPLRRSKGASKQYYYRHIRIQLYRSNINNNIHYQNITNIMRAIWENST